MRRRSSVRATARGWRWSAVFVALLVLMLFLYCGQYALEAMHISIPAFRIAGAAVLFVFALQMIFGGHHSSGSAQARRTPTEVAIFPVAMPGIASPDRKSVV